jgi:hypothetical protein
MKSVGMKFAKMFFLDPALTDGGVRRSVEAGEAFKTWLHTPVANADVHLDLIGSSVLFRAMETAIMEFGPSLAPDKAKKVYQLPWIAEGNVFEAMTSDNHAADVETQQEFMKQLTTTSQDKGKRPAFRPDYKYRGQQWVNGTLKKRGALNKLGFQNGGGNIAKFYAFLAENVLPDLALGKLGSQDKTLRIGVASHSHFLKATFNTYCGLNGRKPDNNDVLAIPLFFEINARGKPSLRLRTRAELGNKPPECAALNGPVSHLNSKAAYKLKPIPDLLCVAETARCRKQVEIQNPSNARKFFARHKKLLAKQAGRPCTCK